MKLLRYLASYSRPFTNNIQGYLATVLRVS